jgi:hypothetical protein
MHNSCVRKYKFRAFVQTSLSRGPSSFVVGNPTLHGVGMHGEEDTADLCDAGASTLPS